MSKTKGLIFAPNKIDRLDKKDIKRVYRSTAESFSGFEFVPIVPLSARDQIGIDTLLRQVIRVHEEMRKYADRRVLQELTRNLKPPVAGVLLRINQMAIRPPIFKVRLTKSVDAAYIKYLRHALRNHFGYAGVPLLIRTEKVNIKKLTRHGE
jgi:predicted GTPase